MPTEAPPLYLFVHVPKVGGTTINAHLRASLAWDEEAVHLGGWGERHRKSAGRAPWAERPLAERARARVLTGHGVEWGLHDLLPDRTARYLTLLRDPVACVMSAYHFKMARYAGSPLDFWDWYRGYPRDANFKFLRKRLAGARGVAGVRAALDRFWFVGTTESLDEDMPHLFSAMGVPHQVVARRRVAGADRADTDHPDQRPIPKIVEANRELRRKVLADHRRDLVLFRYAAGRRMTPSWQ